MQQLLESDRPNLRNTHARDDTDTGDHAHAYARDDTHDRARDHRGLRV